MKTKKNTIKCMLFLAMLLPKIIYSQSTPNGTNLSSYINYYPPLTPSEIASRNNLASNLYPNAIRLEEPTSSYNCHGYAWIKSAGGGIYWLTTPGDDQFWNDGSYVQTSKTNNPDLRVSYQGDHTAVTTIASGVCTSKWGDAGLYRHNTTYVPTIYLPNSTLTYYGRCAAPNLQNMTFDWGSYVNTINFVSVGGHNIVTNALPSTVQSPISWGYNNSGVNFSPSGSLNLNGSFYLGSGQSVTFYTNALGYCGSSSRNITFIAQSNYRLYSNDRVKDILTVGFDNVEYLELLPSEILIHDGFTGEIESVTKVSDKFYQIRLDINKTLSIDVKKLKRGVKIINFIYPDLSSKEKNMVIKKSDRIVLVD